MSFVSGIVYDPINVAFSSLTLTGGKEWLSATLRDNNWCCDRNTVSDVLRSFPEADTAGEYLHNTRISLRRSSIYGIARNCRVDRSTDNDSGDDSGDDSDNDSNNDSGDDNGDDSRDDSRDDSDKDSDDDSGDDSDNDSDDDSDDDNSLIRTS